MGEKTKDKMIELTEKLEKGIADLFNSDKYKQYLDTLSKFHKYSWNNALLIMLQKPDATCVAGFNSWKTKFKRTVNRGEKGLAIFAPVPIKTSMLVEKKNEKGMVERDNKGIPLTEEVERVSMRFRPVYVFDVSQTTGEPLPEIAHNLNFEVEGYEHILESLKQAAGCPVEFEQNMSANGSYNYETHSIKVKAGLSEAQTVKTLIHEMAHASLHTIDDGVTREVKEVEAESVAYVVASHYGIDSSEYSFGYVAGWSNGKELSELKASLDTIRETAAELISRIDECSIVREKETDPYLGIDVSQYAKHGFDAAQTQVILKGIEKGIDVSIFAHAEYNALQMEQLSLGVQNGIDVSILANPIYNPSQMEILRLGIESGLDVSVLANSNLSDKQMSVLLNGLKDGLDVSVFANPDISAERMDEIRSRMVVAINSPTLTIATNKSRGQGRTDL